MISLQRDKQTMWYSLQGEIIPEETRYATYTDADGNEVLYLDDDGTPIPIDDGEVDIGYTEPHKMKASISFGNGEADAQEFGLSVADFDGVIITSKDLYPLDETSLIWYDTEPKTKTDGNVDDKSADYKVVKKKPSLNFDKFLIKKLVK